MSLLSFWACVYLDAWVRVVDWVHVHPHNSCRRCLQYGAWVCEVRCSLHAALRSEGCVFIYARVLVKWIYTRYVEYLIWVCVWGQRSHVVCCGTWGLEVEWDHLAACVPEDLRHVITGVHPAPFGVDTAHLTLVVAALTLRKILKKRGGEHVCCSTCVGMHMSACARVRQTDCRTIFSANSLGQAVPFERERGKVYVCVRPSHTVQRHTGL